MKKDHSRWKNNEINIFGKMSYEVNAYIWKSCKKLECKKEITEKKNKNNFIRQHIKNSVWKL